MEILVRGRFLDEDLLKVVSAVHDHFQSSVKPINVQITDRRSLSANAQCHVWCKQISQQTGEDTRTIFARMKRDFGLPILLSNREHSKVTSYILDNTNFYNLPDDKQLLLIESLEVTRKFSTREHKDFRDNVQAFYNQHGFNLQYMQDDDNGEQ